MKYHSARVNQNLAKKARAITGWQLDERLKAFARKGAAKRPVLPIFILAADWYDFCRLCFERAITSATWLQHPDDLEGIVPGSIEILATANSWKHSMWAHPKTEEYLWN